MENREEQFLIDVAKEHKYQNQTDEYCDEFFKWRINSKNPFGYKFVHDTREHTYVDGEGYLEKTPAQAERKALLKCCTLLGVALLAMVIIDFSKVFIIENVFRISTGSVLYYSDFYRLKPYPIEVVLFSMFLGLSKFLVPILIMKLISKIPNKVIFPKSKNSKEFILSGVAIMLVIIVIARIVNYILADVFKLFPLNAVYFDQIFSSNKSTMFLYFIYQCVAVPILMEIFFRGIILQTFRQFGDVFAIFITSLVSSLCCYSLSQCGYVFCVSVVISLFTIRSGSIKTAFAMRISGRLLNFFTTIITMNLSYTSGKVFECIIGMLIFASSIFVFVNLLGSDKWSFNIKSENLHLSTEQKIKTMFSSTTFAIWGLSTVVAMILTMRII